MYVFMYVLSYENLYGAAYHIIQLSDMCGCLYGYNRLLDVTFTFLSDSTVCLAIYFYFYYLFLPNIYHPVFKSTFFSTSSSSSSSSPRAKIIRVFSQPISHLFSHWKEKKSKEGEGDTHGKNCLRPKANFCKNVRIGLWGNNIWIYGMQIPDPLVTKRRSCFHSESWHDLTFVSLCNTINAFFDVKKRPWRVVVYVMPTDRIYT